MNVTYPAIYRDQSGEEKTIIDNDGKQLKMTVHQVTFIGTDFDSLEPVIPLNHPSLQQFSLAHGALCNCEIECDMPIRMGGGTVPHGNLHVHLKLGPLQPKGSIKYEKLHLRLDYGKQKYFSCGEHGWFDDEMAEIEQNLPDSIYMQCCYSCAFSDYHPAGYGLFGSLFCFRDNKEGYLQVKDKFDLMRIWDTGTEFVQETDLCAAFEKRKSGTGYRG